jgi:hypothetical protein
VVAPIVLLNGHTALGARLRDSVDLKFRLLVVDFALASSLNFLTSLVLVPIDLADNAVLMTAFFTAEDGLICTTRMQLTRLAGRGETMSEIWV